VVLPVFPSHHRLNNDKDEREGRKGAVFFVFSTTGGFSRSSLWLWSGRFGFFGQGAVGSLGRSVWFDPLLGRRTLAFGSSCRCSVRRVIQAKRATVRGGFARFDRARETTRRRTSSTFYSGEVARATAESRIRGVRVSTKGTNTGNRLSDRYMNQADIT